MVAHCQYHHRFAAVRDLANDIHNYDGADHCPFSYQNCCCSSSFSCTHLELSFVHQKSHHLFGCHLHLVDTVVDTREGVEEGIHPQQNVVVVVVASFLGRDTVEEARHHDNHVGVEVEAPLLDFHIGLPAVA